MKSNIEKISECNFKRLSNGHVAVLFVNYKTGEIKAKEYKSMQTAQAQATKFHNQVAMING